MTWEVVIGLEIHAQLATTSKIFSGASTRYGAAPNAHASLLDLGYPGTLPVLNAEAVRMAIKFGLATGCDISRRSVFARKNYFYPDLPKGYQISQYELPLVHTGSVEIELADGATKAVRITRAHLEEDAGKSLHEDFAGMSGIDLNRAGTPRLEIVSEPDLRSAAEAGTYMRKIHALVRYLEICDGNMQEGSFRCDANVSVRRPGAPLGTRCEIKNLNSFRFMEKAIEFEVRRQVELIEDGGKVVQETRLYDPDRGETRPMRSKEDAQDYRYFPDPDLLPVEITSKWIDEVKRSMPELPGTLRAKFESLGIAAYDAHLLTESREKARFFADTMAVTSAPALPVAHWVNGEVSALANTLDGGFGALPLPVNDFARLQDRMHDGTISAKAGKEVLLALAAGEQGTDAVIDKRGLKQISDAGALQAEVDRVIAAQPRFVADYRAGKDKAFNALVGQVMKATQGKANPQEVSRILRERLEKP